MAELVITAANFRNINCAEEILVAGETMSRGQYVYKDSQTQKVWLAQRDGQQFEARVHGVVTADVAAGQRVAVARPGGDIEPGGTLAAGFAYYLGGAAARGTVEQSGLSIPASTHYGTVVFLAKTTARARLLCEASDAAAA